MGPTPPFTAGSLRRGAAGPPVGRLAMYLVMGFLAMVALAGLARAVRQPADHLAGGLPPTSTTSRSAGLAPGSDSTSTTASSPATTAASSNAASASLPAVTAPVSDPASTVPAATIAPTSAPPSTRPPAANAFVTPTTRRTTTTTAAKAECGTDYYRNSSGNCVHRPGTSPAGATAVCGDGTYSYSQHRSGTCSHHGGVSNWL